MNSYDSNTSSVGAVVNGFAQQISHFAQELIDSNIVRVWDLKSIDAVSVNQLTNEIVERSVGSVMSFLQKESPVEYEQMGEERLRKLILANLDNLTLGYEE